MVILRMHEHASYKYVRVTRTTFVRCIIHIYEYYVCTRQDSVFICTDDGDVPGINFYPTDARTDSASKASSSTTRPCTMLRENTHFSTTHARQVREREPIHE